MTARSRTIRRFSGSARRSPCGDRFAFTLLELLIALAVLTLVTLMAWPSVTRRLEENRLQRAGQQVRNEIADTRTRAVESGVLYQFLYEPGGRRFVSIPAERDGAAPRRAGVSLEVASDDLPRYAGELPEGLVFAGSADRLSVQKVQPELFSGLGDAAGLAGIAWAAPVVFREDGSTDDDEFSVSDLKKSKSIPLEIRGFTGSALVGKVTAQEAGL